MESIPSGVSQGAKTNDLRLSITMLDQLAAKSFIWLYHLTCQNLERTQKHVLSIIYPHSNYADRLFRKMWHQNASDRRVDVCENSTYLLTYLLTYLPTSLSIHLSTLG